VKTETKVYTAKVPVDFESGKSKSVQFAWKQNSEFQKGNYKIEIYHNVSRSRRYQHLEERRHLRIETTAIFLKIS